MSKAIVGLVVPSWGRPDQCFKMIERAAVTAEGNVSYVVVVDRDEKQIDRYRHLFGPTVIEQEGKGHVAAINAGAAALMDDLDVTHLIKMDDDHWPITAGWDVKLLEALDWLGGVGIAYGDDLRNGPSVPTVALMNREIVEALGYMGLPELEHMYVDQVWRDLGRVSGRLVYRSDVVIQERHWTLGLSEKDETYERTNTDAQYARDLMYFKAYCQDRFGLVHDAERISQITIERGSK